MNRLNNDDGLKADKDMCALNGERNSFGRTWLFYPTPAPLIHYCECPKPRVGNLWSEGYFRVLARCRKFKKIIIFNIFKVVPFKYIATKILEAAYKIPNLCKNVIKMFQVYQGKTQTCS